MNNCISQFDGVDDSTDAFPFDANKSVVTETEKVSSLENGSPSAFLFLLLFTKNIFKKVDRINKTPNSSTT
ncbi:MAG: hypothetical protein COB83_12325 [Gammaproteobacteria bacterium]|nr:MAG: hypothetical protein COB83_12325 [Gammaproteobacteria bacterium]